jgi:hypothetical protein
MKEIKLQVENITSKQWTNLVIELNLVASAWKSYGPIIKLKTNNLERILKWGRRKPGDPEID